MPKTPHVSCRIFGWFSIFSVKISAASCFFAFFQTQRAFLSAIHTCFISRFLPFFYFKIHVFFFFSHYLHILVLHLWATKFMRSHRRKPIEEALCSVSYSMKNFCNSKILCFFSPFRAFFSFVFRLFQNPQIMLLL